MSKFFKGLKTNSKIKGHDANDEAYFMKQLLDSKVADFDLDVTTLSVLKDADVITLRDLINVDHSKVRWGKHSFTVVDELLENLNLSFVNSPFKNRDLSQVAEFNESCAEELPWIEITMKWEDAEKNYSAHPNDYEDITQWDDDGKAYVMVKGKRFCMPNGTFDDFFCSSDECPVKAEEFEAEGIMALIGKKKFVRKTIKDMAKMDFTPADDLVDEIWGKVGTPQRDAMEVQLEEEEPAYFAGEAMMGEEKA